MVRRKKKFLVRQKGYMVEEDTWENKENLENAKELVAEFEREYGEEAEELRQQEQKEEEKEYLGNLQQNYYMDGRRKSTRRRGRKDRRKIGINGKIPRNKKT